jgi:hypothetical protein
VSRAVGYDGIMNRVRGVAIAVMAALAAGCSASPSSSAGGASSAGGSANISSAVAYSQCIRSHGVPSFPDPPGDGQVPKVSAQELGVSDSQLAAAQRACQRLYPAGSGLLNRDSIGQCEQTGDCPPALVRQAVHDMLIFARCMHSHAVPGWPDPRIDSEGRPGFNLLHVGFNPDSAQVSNAMQECGQTMPVHIPIPVIQPGGPG